MLDPKHFPEEFLHAMARRPQRLAAQRSYAVHAPPDFPSRSSESADSPCSPDRAKWDKGFPHSVCTHGAPAPRRSKPVKRLFGRVVEDVQADQPRVETFIIHIDFRCPVSISKSNIERRTTICQWAMKALSGWSGRSHAFRAAGSHSILMKMPAHHGTRLESHLRAVASPVPVGQGNSRWAIRSTQS